MRRIFIPLETALTRYKAKQYAFWAAHVARVNGGWMAFESAADWHTWKAQK